MKPKFLFCCGWNWSATSPLIYTLQRNVKYAHFGYTKTLKYLEKPNWEVNKGVRGDVLRNVHEKNIKFIYKKYCEGTWENYKSYQSGSHRMNLPVDLEPLRDFPLDHFTKLVTGTQSLSKFIDFYLALYYHVVSKGYKSVGSNYIGHRYNVPNNELKEIQSEFDIKVLFIARDPIRRAWGQYLNKFDRNELPCQLNIKDYVKALKEVRMVYGESNVYVTVMEELWEGDGAECEKLSQFLDHPIKKSDLWKNLYAPDRGHYVKFDKDVPCQAHCQELLELTPEIYWYYRKKFDYVYKNWEEQFGQLPLFWGEPIEYKPIK